MDDESVCLDDTVTYRITIRIYAFCPVASNFRVHLLYTYIVRQGKVGPILDILFDLNLSSSTQLTYQSTTVLNVNRVKNDAS